MSKEILLYITNTHYNILMLQATTDMTAVQDAHLNCKIRYFTLLTEIYLFNII